MRFLTGIFPAAICVGGMALCMRMMSKGHATKGSSGSDEQSSLSKDVGELQDEVSRLRAELKLRDDSNSR
jgi:hypothetical protein